MVKGVCRWASTCLCNVNTPMSDSVCDENVVRHRRSARLYMKRLSETSESVEKEKKKHDKTNMPVYNIDNIHDTC